MPKAESFNESYNQEITEVKKGTNALDLKA
jgi:hypothetical protein